MKDYKGGIDIGNIAYQAADKKNIDKLVSDMRSKNAYLKRKNRKLTGTLKQKIIDHIELKEEEFFEEFDDIHLGDIVEIICLKEIYGFNKTKDEYYWPYQINKNYVGFVTYKVPGYAGYLKLLLMNTASYKTSHYTGDLFHMNETLELSKQELEIEEGIFKIRRLYKTDSSQIEILDYPVTS